MSPGAKPIGWDYPSGLTEVGGTSRWVHPPKWCSWYLSRTTRPGGALPAGHRDGCAAGDHGSRRFANLPVNSGTWPQGWVAPAEPWAWLMWGAGLVWPILTYLLYPNIPTCGMVRMYYHPVAWRVVGTRSLSPSRYTAPASG